MRGYFKKISDFYLACEWSAIVKLLILKVM